MYTEYLQFKRLKSQNLKPTSPDILGPFYKPDAPFRESLVPSPTLTISGRVLDTSGHPLKNALMDVWQADEKGNYDNDGFNLRAKNHTNDKGEYRFCTVWPGDYKISETEFRCAHIHFKVSAEGHKSLTTQLYFAGVPHNDTEHWFDPDRVVAFPENPSFGVFDFVLE